MAATPDDTRVQALVHAIAARSPSVNHFVGTCTALLLHLRARLLGTTELGQHALDVPEEDLVGVLGRGVCVTTWEDVGALTRAASPKRPFAGPPASTPKRRKRSPPRVGDPNLDIPAPVAANALTPFADATPVKAYMAYLANLSPLRTTPRTVVALSEVVSPERLRAVEVTASQMHARLLHM